MDAKAILGAVGQLAPALALLNPALAAAGLAGSVAKAVGIGQTVSEILADVQAAIARRELMASIEDHAEISRLLAEIAAENDALGAAIDDS